MERFGRVVPVLFFAVGDELFREGGTGRAADDILEEPPEVVEAHGAGDGRGDEENGDDSDADYLPCSARVVAFRGHGQDGCCSKGGLEGGGLGRRGGARGPLLLGGVEGRLRRVARDAGGGLEGVECGVGGGQGGAVAGEQAENIALGEGERRECEDEDETWYFEYERENKTAKEESDKPAGDLMEPSRIIGNKRRIILVV